MPIQVKANITPAVFSWARKKSGFSISEISRRINVSAEIIEYWENGTEKPSISQIRKICKIVKRPFAFFLLPTPPIDYDAIRDYRRLPGQEIEQESPDLLYAIRYANERRSIVIDLLEQLGDEITTNLIPINSNDDPEDIAISIRSQIDISYENQTSTNSYYKALNLWKDKIEGKGILVFQFGDVDRSEARGFSIMNIPLPVISINRSEVPQARIFSILHEFVHLLLHKGGLCNFNEFNNTYEEQRVEIFCNRLAGAIIAPKIYLLNESEVISHTPEDEMDEIIIKKLSKKYGCSREVILRRLLLFGLITQTFYENKKREYSREFETEHDRRTGFAPPYQIALSNNGKYFTNIVLKSYYNNNINSSTLSEYLGVRLKHIPRIEMALAN